MERDPAARTPSARALLDDLGRDFGLVRGSTWDARPELLTPPFCGRVELLGRFSQALRHAAEGSGKAIVVLGPEGAGKSRLLAEWRALAQSEGALVVEGRAVAEDRTPYRPVLDVLSALTRRGGSAGAPARAALARVARLAATGAEAPPISRLTEESSRLALFDEVLAALEATRRTEAGDRPLVVLVDDLHLADRATAALLSFLFKAAESRPLVVAAAAEPAGPTEPGADPNEALTPLEDLALPPWTLTPLSEGETANAASGALGRKDLPEELTRLVHHESQGWPGPLVSLLEQLVEKRVVSLRDGQLVVDAELRRRFSRPGAAAEWADARLAALPPGTAGAPRGALRRPRRPDVRAGPPPLGGRARRAFGRRRARGRRPRRRPRSARLRRASREARAVGGAGLGVRPRQDARAARGLAPRREAPPPARRGRGLLRGAPRRTPRPPPGRRAPRPPGERRGAGRPARPRLGGAGRAALRLRPGGAVLQRRARVPRPRGARRREGARFANGSATSTSAPATGGARSRPTTSSSRSSASAPMPTTPPSAATRRSSPSRSG